MHTQPQAYGPIFSRGLSHLCTAIKAVSAHEATTGLVADAMTALQTLAISNSVRLTLVPGHCGINGNEKVDSLAKQASSSCHTGPEPSLGISVSTIYSSICSWTVHEQNKLWQELSGCRQAKCFLYGCDHSWVRYAVNLAKQDLRILVDLNRHLHIMGLILYARTLAVPSVKRMKIQFFISLYSALP